MYQDIWKVRKLRTFWELKLFCYSSVHNFAAAITAILVFFSSHPTHTLHNCSATQLSLAKEINWSGGTIVSTVIMLQAGQSWFQIPAGARNLSP
jgi:hypothetical protein